MNANSLPRDPSDCSVEYQQMLQQLQTFSVGGLASGRLHHADHCVLPMQNGLMLNSGSTHDRCYPGDAPTNTNSQFGNGLVVDSPSFKQTVLASYNDPWAGCRARHCNSQTRSVNPGTATTDESAVFVTSSNRQISHGDTRFLTRLGKCSAGGVMSN
eukprot:Lankesteria_metandrocarpae@DN6259_c0_g1_i1.p1